MRIINQKTFLFLIAIIFFVFLLMFNANLYLLKKYNDGRSIIILDRNGAEAFLIPNKKGYLSKYISISELPTIFKELIIKKEDKYFYYHLGFNPKAILEYALSFLNLSSRKGSSTITQQVVKILLDLETKRSLLNKLRELFFAISLEVFQSKDKILEMYINSIYLGNKAQGLEIASEIYFSKPLNFLSTEEFLQLLAAINSPIVQNPGSFYNISQAKTLAKNLGLNFNEKKFVNFVKVDSNIKNYFKNYLYYDYQALIDSKNFNSPVVKTTIDKKLNLIFKKIIKEEIELLKEKNAHHSALIVIKLPENEILSLVGSPDFTAEEYGAKINMLFKKRPIGSTVKPFIYLLAFEKGLRPYTLVEDKEYRYLSSKGFSFYPQNYDKKFYGKVTLHYALANSLNVPSLKVLEFIGVEKFKEFLTNLGFNPSQPFENYQLTISLGALEMSLFELAHYFTIFPNGGVLKNLKLFADDYQREKRVANIEYIQLINKILSDHKINIDQFGYESYLNLFQKNYAYKTGTSKDFKDSWIIGYTPDFLVGVWVGNADNSPMEKVSGQIGSGKIWSRVMNILLNSHYNKNSQFTFDKLKVFNFNGQIEYGLENDDYLLIKNVLLTKENSLIEEPHHNDVFVFSDRTRLPLKAKEKVDWFINNEFIGREKEIIFKPPRPGEYLITVKDNNKSETIKISFIEFPE